ncbi:MAG: hypothetical protein NXH73_01730 [Flavobacteriaceae bacterium]|nr:hypothetical protein [Flavobacteriaceae bacterium]
MKIEIAKWIVIFFGLFIIVAGLIMLFNPKRARTILRKFASTNFINYTEITLRMLVGVALILYSDFCKFPELFKILGWFMFITALILYLVPRKLHHKFSTRSADIIKPIYFRFIAPFAFVFGGLILYNVNWV